VDRLCRLLDHPLQLASTLGKGSRFSIIVPQAPARVEPAEVPDRLQAMIQPFAGKFVVMIEDDRLVLDSMDGLLRGWGCRVSASTSSGAALADLSELDEKPDLIISDHHFTHGETGVAVIERLRRAFDAPIPALLVTGDISVERKQEAEARGYELLQKPVPPMILRATMNEILKRRGSIDAPARDNAPASSL
jgi:CheY-like chemotaxis protein